MSWISFLLKRPIPIRTSVLLKRQIPIRFDEAPRSWLGGLPMMPILTEWPRDAKGAPLHFIAQICCADLPKTLWNGLGPRKGWLLLFVNTLKMEDYAHNGVLQVLHTNSLGSEHQPPEDSPTVRHSMSDYIDRFTPNIRPCVPKFWRKWPVDIVVEDVGSATTEPDEQQSSYRKPSPLDRPLTWRGARYVIEGILRDLEPGAFKRDARGMRLIRFDAPEFDSEGRRKEIYDRAMQDPNYHDGYLGSFGPNSDLYNRIEAEVIAERRIGWIKRAHQAFDADSAKFMAAKAEFEQAEADGREKEDVQLVTGMMMSKEGVLWNLERFEGYRRALDNIIAQYPDPDPEAALTEEIQHLGQAYLKWGQTCSLKHSWQCRKSMRTIPVPSSLRRNGRISPVPFLNVHRGIGGVMPICYTRVVASLSSTIT